MKTLLRSFFAVAFISGIAFAPTYIVGEAGGAASASNPGFDIINKTGSPITIHLVNGYQPTVRKAIVQPALTAFGATLKSNHFSKQINSNEPTLLAVWTKPLSNKETDFLATRVTEHGVGTEKFFDNWTVWPKPDYVYHFTPGKDIYVTLDKNGEMRPQTGPKKGATGKTEAGYPLANEVQQKDILRYTGSIGQRGDLT